MIQDIKEQIDRELPETQSVTVDINAIVTAGRRRKRRRRILTGAALSIVAAVSVGALLVAGVPTTDPTITADDTPSLAPPVKQPSVTLPEIDPEGDYVWESFEGHTTTEATAHYSVVLQDTLETMYPGYVNVDYWSHGAPTDLPEFGRVEFTLNEITEVWPDDGEEWEPLHTQPVYTARQSADASSGPLYLQLEPDSHPEQVQVQVWPNGGFTTGTDGITDLIECTDFSRVSDFEGQAVHEHSCSEARGPSGELVRQSFVEVSHSVTGATFWRTNTTVVYRLDGTAVVVTDQVSKEDEGRDDALADLGDRHPGISLDEQLELALALPGTIVE